MFVKQIDGLIENRTLIDIFLQLIFKQILSQNIINCLKSEKEKFLL
ncbi:MAG: hypothetical protein CH6_0525 [Candidatus Kapaibacterium sp.]|nr:MAG: hypothetical protein CH6_0525 [Candidatus Kapabacteria bacterium]